jgi:hypothetical protein
MVKGRSMRIRFRSLCTAALLAAAMPAAGLAANGTSREASCIGFAVSGLGPIDAGIFWVLNLFPGALGEVGRTHCDPSWD